MAVYRVQDTSLTAVADAIRAKAGTSDALTFPDGFVKAVGGIQAGGGGAAGASPKEVNFYDYDGTLLHAYTVAEARRMAELPAGPTHKGLVFQGWNWSLGAVRSLTRAMNIGAMYTTDDGTTRLYITLQEGRTSPMLGICVNGTVTVDWGDGTVPDVLTGTNASSSPVWTPNHAYAAPGDYVIRLTIDGYGGFAGKSGTNQGSYALRHSASADARNNAYQASLKRVELGKNTRSINSYAFYGCTHFTSITIPSSVTGINTYSFANCYNLTSVNIPDGVTNVNENTFYGCRCLTSITIPSSVTSIGSYAFANCYALASATIPNGVTSIGNYAFQKCNVLGSVNIPDGVKSIGGSAFSTCCVLKHVNIPYGVTKLNDSLFDSCQCITSITIPSSVTSIGSNVFYSCLALVSVTFAGHVPSITTYTFGNCVSLTMCDFTMCTTVPTLLNSNAFNKITSDCEIRVPAALYDEWIAATNWSAYADYIKAY